MPQPVGEWSFYRGSRIDHVLASSSLPMPSATYVTAIAGVDLASANTSTRVSDHAALVVDLEIWASPINRVPCYQLRPN